MFNCKLASRDLGVARAACAHVFRLQFSVLGRIAKRNRFRSTRVTTLTYICTPRAVWCPQTPDRTAHVHATVHSAQSYRGKYVLCPPPCGAWSRFNVCRLPVATCWKRWCGNLRCSRCHRKERCAVAADATLLPCGLDCSWRVPSHAVVSDPLSSPRRLLGLGHPKGSAPSGATGHHPQHAVVRA
jgi:hypothetical protein